ncbi:hypothetical protein MN608_06924 [Microdochium nivale]|nr:hypothetical protein MN608_06924 [Microdochium nivale]
MFDNAVLSVSQHALTDILVSSMIPGSWATGPTSPRSVQDKILPALRALTERFSQHPMPQTSVISTWGTLVVAIPTPLVSVAGASDDHMPNYCVCSTLLLRRLGGARQG